MQWSSFGTEVCADCTKHWEGFFAEENALCENPLQASTAGAEQELEDLDLDRLLASVRFNEREDTEVFSQICHNDCSPLWTVGHFVPTAVVFHSSRAGKELPDHLLQAFRSPSQNQIDQRWTERSRWAEKRHKAADGKHLVSSKANHSIGSTEAGQFCADHCSAQHTECANQARRESSQHGGLECSGDESGIDGNRESAGYVITHCKA